MQIFLITPVVLSLVESSTSSWFTSSWCICSTWLRKDNPVVESRASGRKLVCPLLPFLHYQAIRIQLQTDFLLIIVLLITSGITMYFRFTFIVSKSGYSVRKISRGQNRRHRTVKT